MRSPQFALIFLMVTQCCFLAAVPQNPRPFIGEMRWVTWSNIPSSDWVRCDGRSLNPQSYPNLYTLIGNTFGGTPGRQFNIPDMRGRTPLGAGQGPTLSMRQIGLTGGTERETISVEKLAPHSHNIQGTSQTGNTNSPTENLLASKEFAYKNATPNIPLDEMTLADAGLGQSVENLSPFTTLYCIFAVDGIFPPPPAAAKK